jgi:hypothetical protein
MFKTQLRQNNWSQGEISAQSDLLGNPAACRSQANCPLNGPERRLTVCPFGFWGFVHQIEQPIQHLNPKTGDQVPPELNTPQAAASFNQDVFIQPDSSTKVHVAIGAYPGIPNSTEHFNEIRATAPPEILRLEISDDRDQVLSMLEEGGRQIYYYYCHGVIRNGEFRLKLGPLGSDSYLSAADLDPRESRWQVGFRPLVIINGCETMRLTPELIHGFLGVLKGMGAAGVVGTEIPVNILLARPFGFRLMQHLIGSASIGEAFLEIRRHLARQANPLGLAYSFYAPAALHIHHQANCQWCARHARKLP